MLEGIILPSVCIYLVLRVPFLHCATLTITVDTILDIRMTFICLHLEGAA